MDELERQRANREAKALAVRSPHESGLVKYLAAESYVTQHQEDNDDAAGAAARGHQRPT